MESSPRVSIGMTVYNAARFVRETLDSLLAQDYPDFELVISDNASTDGSSEICREYASRDARIRYYRNDENIGAVRNWNRTLELARGEYFMWAADHDLYHPSYVQTCLRTLASDPMIVLCYSPAVWIDIDGRELYERWDRIDVTSQRARDRYVEAMRKLKHCTAYYGVTRTALLRDLGGAKDLWAFDFLLLSQLALEGKFALTSETLFRYRLNRPEEVSFEQKRQRHLRELSRTGEPSRAHKTRDELHMELRDAHLRMLDTSFLGAWDRAVAKMVTILAFRQRYGVGIPFVGVVGRAIPGAIRRLLWSVLGTATPPAPREKKNIRPPVGQG